MHKKRGFLLLVCMVLLCMLPNILLVLIGEDSVVGTFVKKVVYLVLALALILLPLSLLRPKWYGWVVFLLSPFLLFELYNVYTFKAPSSEEAVASIFFTNYGEASELLDGSITTLISALILFFFAFFMALLMPKKYRLSKKTRTRVAAFSLLTFAALYARNYTMAAKLKDNFSETIGLANYSLRIQMSKIYPIDVLIKTRGAYQGLNKRKNYIKNVSSFSFGSIKKDTVAMPEIYVLVIGETARKHNFGLYGYERNTTPNLDTIQNIVHFKNARSNANLTSLSIPFMITRATPNNAAIKFEEPAVISAFKEAGFKTYWLTNVPSGVGSVFGFYSGLADEYYNTSVSLDALNFDNQLIPELENVLSDTSTQKKFIILHTLGSHFRYNYRYPKEFEKFTPNLEKGLSMENATSIYAKDKIINSYDNSILYTDYILSSFIQLLKEQNALSYLYYISDHGENLYDDNTNKLMHAYIRPTKYEIEVPLILWYSASYKERYTSKIQSLTKNSMHPVQTINTFHTLLDMANITYSGENLTRSLSAHEFDTIAPYYFYGTDKMVYKNLTFKDK